MAYQEFGLSHRKIVPDSRDNLGKVDRQPDVRVPRFKFYSFAGQEFEREMAEHPTRGFQAIIPLTPVFETPIGGGRVYGGGTSREALRRAKQHQKR